MAHFELVEKMAPNAVIKVIGVGGGGGNAVAHMVSSNVDGVEFITANTDSQAIKNCGAKLQLQLGGNVTKGLGAGANPEVGRQAALEDRERDHGRAAGRRHGVHHRRHGWRHRHRRGAGGGAAGQGNGHPDRRRGHQAVPVRRPPAHAGRAEGHRGAQPALRLADHHPERKTDHRAGPQRDHDPGLPRRQRRAAGRRAGHRRPDRASGPDQRRLRRRAHRDVAKWAWR